MDYVQCFDIAFFLTEKRMRKVKIQMKLFSWRESSPEIHEGKKDIENGLPLFNN